MNENENIVKPMTLLKDDFEKNLVSLCNNSGLPFFIMEYIVRDLHTELKTLSQKQFESDLIRYRKLMDGVLPPEQLDENE